jgi:hypothetical protein
LKKVGYTMKILSLHDTVKELLEADPRLRDSDKKLWARLVMNHLGGKEMCQVMSAYELLYKMVNDELPSWESCTRIRRMIQEDNEHLRGTNYKKRQEKQEEVQQDLGYKIDLR